VVKSLTPSQKEQLKAVLSETKTTPEKKSDLTELLLSGPVFSKKQIDIIKQNRKSIKQWRTKK
jgi:ABC-type phosphate/phosphonate transport system substrate-binding protein